LTILSGRYQFFSFTTGIDGFAECLKHSTKTLKHSANSLSSVALGKEGSTHSASANSSLSNTFSQALVKDFTECHEVLGKEKQLSRRRVTETASLLSVLSDTRQTSYLCRVSAGQHSVKNPPARSPCQVLCRVLCMALDKAWFFAECQSHYTRQRTYTGAQVLVLCRVLWS
jgi:hypothetical protein